MIQDEISGFETLLGVKFPLSYREFLKKHKSMIVDGYKIMGFETASVPMTVIDATLILRMARPDLHYHLIAVMFVRSKAICLSLMDISTTDAALIEIDLESYDPPRWMGCSFSEWLRDHEVMGARIARTVQRIKNRKHETRGTGIKDWSTPIFRANDYVLAWGTFRYSPIYSCLEVDSFLPIDQPHVVKYEPHKLLLSEALIRARDFAGSLKMIFTRDIREDEYARIRPKKDWPAIYNSLRNEDQVLVRQHRKPVAIPKVILELADMYGVQLQSHESGIITHYEALSLWFKLLELSSELEDRVELLEKYGYLTKEMLAEVIFANLWIREEAIWILENAPRPEAIILGSDHIGDRLSHLESLNYGRIAMLATKLRFAIMAEMNDGFSMDELEKAIVFCHLSSVGEFWLLHCNHDFRLPMPWNKFGEEPMQFKKDQKILTLILPYIPGSQELTIKRLKQYLDKILKTDIDAQGYIIALANEYASPYYCSFVDKIQSFVQTANNNGVFVLFAPTRTDLYIDQDLEARMVNIRSMTKFPARQEKMNLLLYSVPSEYWDVPEGSTISRAIRNAHRSAKIFAEQLVFKREVKRYLYEYHLMCEVIEREAMNNHKLFLEVDRSESQDLIQALRRTEESLNDITLPFVCPKDMPDFINKLSDNNLKNQLKMINGGLVVVPKPFSMEFITPTKKDTNLKEDPYNLTQEQIKQIDESIAHKKETKGYVSHWNEIDKTHLHLRECLALGTPFSIASLHGKVRATVFSEVLCDYLYKDIAPRKANLLIAYGDGSRGGPFPLFSLSKIQKPDTNGFLRHHVGTVSLRHMESDYNVDQYLIRNRDIQNRENASEQEDLAYRKTYDFLSELMQIICGEKSYKEAKSISMKILLGLKPIIHEKKWNGLNLHVFHTTGLESAGIGVFKAVLDIIKEYQGLIIVTPRILNPKEYFLNAQEWY